KPEALPTEAFEAGMRLMDDELATLKTCIESRPPAPRTAGEIVEALYDGFRRRDIPAIFSLLAPDVKVVQSDRLPWGGRYSGHEGARDFFGNLLAHLRSDVKFDRFIEAGEHIAAIGWTAGTVLSNGAAFRVPVVHVWRIRNGQAVGVQFFIDHPPMLEAL